MVDYTQLALPETIQIPLTKGRTAIVDLIDADLAQLKWYCSRWDYANRKNTRGHWLMHRVILARKIGRDLLPDELCDHINRDRCDNRRDNLRVCSNAQNILNRKVSSLSTTGYKGVLPPEGGHHQYRARIKLNGKSRIIGSFDTAEEAHEAYCKAAKELFGEFACLD